MPETPPDEPASFATAPVIESLLESLGEAFDLRTPTLDGTLGEAVRQRLMAIETGGSPAWGVPGSLAQVAHRESQALDFYYRPHLFPEMSPELRLAHHLQFDLLPRQLSASAPVEIAAVLESYCHLSGDLLGWRDEPTGLLLWIVDVAGHGVRAGLAAAVVHFLIAGLPQDGDLADQLGELNERMREARNSTDRRALHATAFLTRIDRSGRCSYAGAGHPPVFVRASDRRVAGLFSQGPPIGLIADQVYRSDPFRLDPDGLLFLYTDGLLEARDPDGEEFGLERIESLVRAAEGAPLKLSRAAYRTARSYRDTTLLDDDLTFLAARPV